jgi:hypothetical protein
MLKVTASACFLNNVVLQSLPELTEPLKVLHTSTASFDHTFHHISVVYLHCDQCYNLVAFNLTQWPSHHITELVKIANLLLFENFERSFVTGCYCLQCSSAVCCPLLLLIVLVAF